MYTSVAIAVKPAPEMKDPTRAKNPAPPPPLDDAAVEENDRRVVGICLCDVCRLLYQVQKIFFFKICAHDVSR